MVVQNQEKMLARYEAVSLILARVGGGMKQSTAIDEVARLTFGGHFTKRQLTAKRRTLYRWLRAFKHGGFDALADSSRVQQTPSLVLSGEVIALLETTKTKDEEASIPDIIRQAEMLGLVEEGSLSRTTVWRTARKLGLPLPSSKSKTASTKRRFAYPHRMQMVLCDGKQFRAGYERRRRLAFFFIDDATRKLLVAIIGTSETKELFLRGIMKVIRRYGLMSVLYVDNGSGFIAGDAETVCARIGIHLVHGTEGYPEGRGKIERFNRTVKADLLRTLDGDPAVDSGFESLEMRCEHYRREVYNRRKHESLGMSPDDRWAADTLPLVVPENISELEKHFTITSMRKVSLDNIISFDGKAFEMPFGYSGRLVKIDEDLLTGTVSFLHEGRYIALKEADLSQNARYRRAKAIQAEEPVSRQIRTAARLAYDQDFEPITSPSGDFTEE